jgi:gamma-glutamylcyclotransferase (GGCT)/AIG2-like uncharacterized protein YtfP
MNDIIRVFVYGTLQPGEKYHQPYCGGWVIGTEPARVRGQLYHLPLGYPGLAAGTDIVHGSLLSFNNPAILPRLDELEDYSPQRALSQNLYQRERTMVLSPNGAELGEAWIYRMALSRIQALGGSYLPDGRWSGAIAAAL